MTRLIIFSILLISSSTIVAQSPISFQQVEQAPVFKGCAENTIELTKHCTQKGIERFAKEKFNTGLFKGLNLNEKRIRIYAQFTISKSGTVKNIKVRTPYPKLKTEALRVLKLLPSFKPGKDNGATVETSYSLPLVFVLG